jgi:hypothetical protein
MAASSFGIAPVPADTQDLHYLHSYILGNSIIHIHIVAFTFSFALSPRIGGWKRHSSIQLLLKPRGRLTHYSIGPISRKHFIFWHAPKAHGGSTSRSRPIAAYNSPLGQHRLRLRWIVLRPVDHLPRHPCRLRDGGRTGVLFEHVSDDVELHPVEARLPAPIAVRPGGCGVGYASLLGVSVGFGLRSAVAAMKAIGASLTAFV